MSRLAVGDKAVEADVRVHLAKMIAIVIRRVDLKNANIKKGQSAFPQYEVIGISAKYGKNMDEFYEGLFALAG